ncbi:MAG: RidA family protein [Gammaproteobacteria bacterium]|nr:MAG: RidA family protein [Gammaproteobacteria bacterium]
MITRDHLPTLPTHWERPAMSFEAVNPASSKALYDQFHFSQAARTGDLLVCSGQIGTNADGSVPDSLDAEFENAWRAVGAVLESAGLDYANIIEYTTYHVGLSDSLGPFMKARDAVLSEPWPAWTAIGITELAVPGAHLEIRVTATAG